MYARRLQRGWNTYARLARSRAPRPVPYYPKRFNSQNPGQVTSGPLDQDDGDGGEKTKDDGPGLKSTILRMLETAATTFASIAILGYVLIY